MNTTKGPWKWRTGMLHALNYEEQVLWPGNVPGGDDDPTWAQQLGAYGIDAEKNAEGNALLLESAPELLEEIENIIKCYENDPATINLRMAREIVRKIRGN